MDIHITASLIRGQHFQGQISRQNLGMECLNVWETSSFTLTCSTFKF